MDESHKQMEPLSPGMPHLDSAGASEGPRAFELPISVPVFFGASLRSHEMAPVDLHHPSGQTGAETH